MAAALAGCPGVPVGSRTGARDGALKPDSCGPINGTDAGRKLYAFLNATVELDRQVTAVEKRARQACLDMGAELGLPGDQLEGDTKTVCNRVAASLREHLQGGLRAEAQMNVTYKPAVCTVDVQAAAQASAECSGSASAEAQVTCEGTCSGTCYGQCSGTCSAKNASGECAGQCTGACQGRCEGSCQGSADVKAEAECEAAAEIRANANVECTPAQVEVAYDAAMVVDGEKLERAKKAIDRGLPSLLTAAAIAKGPMAKAVATWASTVRGLYDASKDIASQFGKQALCVSGQIAAAFEAMAHIQVSLSVSVEASVSVGGACGATAG